MSPRRPAEQQTGGRESARPAATRVPGADGIRGGAGAAGVGLGSGPGPTLGPGQLGGLDGAAGAAGPGWEGGGFQEGFGPGGHGAAFGAQSLFDAGGGAGYDGAAGQAMYQGAGNDGVSGQAAYAGGEPGAGQVPLDSGGHIRYDAAAGAAAAAQVAVEAAPTGGGAGLRASNAVQAYPVIYGGAGALPYDPAAPPVAHQTGPFPEITAPGWSAVEERAALQAGAAAAAGAGWAPSGRQAAQEYAGPGPGQADFGAYVGYGGPGGPDGRVAREVQPGQAVLPVIAAAASGMLSGGGAGVGAGGEPVELCRYSPGGTLLHDPAGPGVAGVAGVRGADGGSPPVMEGPSGSAAAAAAQTVRPLPTRPAPSEAARQQAAAAAGGLWAGGGDGMADGTLPGEAGGLPSAWAVVDPGPAAAGRGGGEYARGHSGVDSGGDANPAAAAAATAAAEGQRGLSGGHGGDAVGAYRHAGHGHAPGGAPEELVRPHRPPLLEAAGPDGVWPSEAGQVGPTRPTAINPPPPPPPVAVALVEAATADAGGVAGANWGAWDGSGGPSSGDEPASAAASAAAAGGEELAALEQLKRNFLGKLVRGGQGAMSAATVAAAMCEPGSGRRLTEIQSRAGQWPSP